jgi:hypothetical protein
LPLRSFGWQSLYEAALAPTAALAQMVAQFLIKFSNSRQDTLPPSRGLIRPSCARTLSLENQGAGKAGYSLHPKPRVQKAKARRASSPQVQPEAPGISPRNGFNGLLRALPGDEFLLVTVIRGLRLCRNQVGPTCLRELDTSNGCQNHTTWPSAHAPFVRALTLFSPWSQTMTKRELVHRGPILCAPFCAEQPAFNCSSDASRKLAFAAREISAQEGSRPRIFRFQTSTLVKISRPKER